MPQASSMNETLLSIGNAYPRKNNQSTVLNKVQTMSSAKPPRQGGSMLQGQHQYKTNQSRNNSYNNVATQQKV